MENRFDELGEYRRNLRISEKGICLYWRRDYVKYVYFSS